MIILAWNLLDRLRGLLRQVLSRGEVLLHHDVVAIVDILAETASARAQPGSGLRIPVWWRLLRWLIQILPARAHTRVLMHLGSRTLPLLLLPAERRGYIRSRLVG